MTLSFPLKACRAACLGLLLSLLSLLSLASAWGIGPDQDLRATDATSFVLGDDSGYGSAIVTAGDWMAVGAPGTATDNTSTYAGGRVFLWKHESGAWQMKQQLTWPEPDAAADPANAFGRRLALRGTRLLVSSASPLGKVFVFDLVSGVWTLSATLTPQGSDTAGAGFGDALALSASGSVAVIGSPTGQSEGETSPTGWLDVYERVDSAWLHRGRLTDPLHGAGLGKTLTLHGDTIIAGRPQSTGGAGSVAIFERSGDVWSQTQRLLPPNSTALYGSQVLAYADRLFVLAAGSGGGSSGSGNGALLEYSLPDRSLLATVTVSLRPAQGTPLLATDGTRLAICSPGLNASQTSLLVRGQAGSWSSRPHYLTDSYSSAPQFDKKALAFRSGELLLGGSATQTFYLGGDTDTTSTHWTVRAADDQTPGYSNYWMDKGQVVPMSRSRLDVLNFGYSTAWDGQWLVVGTPNNRDSYQTFRDGFVSLYRRTAQGSLQFHSFLPEPAGVRGAGQPAFGRQVSLSGDRIAVGRVLGGPQSFPGVLIYAWDASLGQWLQEAHLTPPEEAGLYGTDFGSTLSLSGDRLAIGAAEDGAVFIYRRTGTEWSLETQLGPPAPDPEIPEYFGRRVALSGSTLLVTSDTDAGDAQDTAYFYELKQGTWTRVARFPRPASQTSGSFATSISLEGDRALIGRESPDGQTSPAALYQRTSGVWKHHSDLPAEFGSISSEPPVCLSGATAILGTGGAPSFHTLSGTKWISTYPNFAEDMRYGFSMADGMLIGAAWGRRVQVRSLTRVPDIYVYADSVSWSRDGNVQHLDLGEYLVGTRTDQVATLRFFHQGSTSVRCTITPSGDVADFTPSATSLSVPLGTSPLKAPEMYLRFAPKTTGPKELTLTITTGTPHETPQVVIIRAQVVAQAQPVTFLEQPQPELDIGSGSYVTFLTASVQGTRPMTYRWTRNGSTFPQTYPLAQYYVNTSSRSGGIYRLEVTNPAGKFLSDPAPRAKVRVKTPRAISLVGKTAQAELEVDGPVKIRWHRAPDSGPLQPLSDGGRLSGTTQPVLKITQGEPQDTGRYTAQITLDQPGDAPPSGQLSADIHIVSPLLATLSSPTGHTLPLNVPATLQCSHYLAAPTDHLTAAYTITGLPPGLRENPAREGEITGTPTKAGLYQVKITAKVGPFTSAPFIVPIVVKESALATPGIYWGLIPPGLEYPLGGAVTVDLQPSGALTGTLQTGAQRTSFTSLMHQPSLWRSDYVTHTKHIFPSGFQRSWLQHIPEDGSLDFRLMHVTQPLGISVPPLTRLRLMKPLVPVSAPPPEVLGTHSVAMLGTGVGSDTVADVPAGHSFGTLTIKADRSATLAGQLADGSTLTGTGWYSQDQPGRPARLHLYAADKTGRSSLRGIVPMLPEEPDPDPDPDPDPEPESELTATAEDTPHLLWSMGRSGTSRTYPEGFYDQRLPWITSRYAAKVPGQGLTPGDKYLWLSPPGREPQQIPFALSSKLAVIPSTGLLNPWGAKLTLPPATGLFTGTYTLQDPDPVNPGKTLTRSATFKGIYLPRQRRGYGYSLVPDLPDPAALPPTTSLKDTPVPSSAVEIVY